MIAGGQERAHRISVVLVGRLADYAEMAAREGLLGLLWANARGGLNVAPGVAASSSDTLRAVKMLRVSFSSVGAAMVGMAQHYLKHRLRIARSQGWTQNA